MKFILFMEIHHYESVPSTNTALMKMSKKGAKSWTVIWTSDQTQGKGYTGNIWTSEKNKNLAVSVLINSNLNYNDLIYFNQWVCNCISDTFKAYAKNVYVKWPNDIILNNKKICGVLIETYKSDNQLNIVSGIGININQTEFFGLEKAGSLATETNKFYEIKEILSALLTNLQKTYHQIENKDWKRISKDYNSNLFKKNKQSIFRMNNEVFNGVIKFVDESGLLNVETEDGIIKRFKNKEVELFY